MRYPRSLNLGASLNRSLLIRALCPTHVSHFRMYLLFTIICIDMTSVLAKLGCLAPVLTPTFLIVRLGGKGSTSTIVTAGSAGRVPQTGWSRKLAFLREYSVGELKDDFLLIHLSAPRCFFCSFRSPDMHFRACLPGKGTLNGTILPGRCFLLTM